MKAYPSAYTRQRILSQNGKKGFIVHLFLGEIKKLRDMNPRRTCLLTRGCHEGRVGFLETPLPCFYNLGTAIRDGDDKCR
jgi:hypothetical protein